MLGIVDRGPSATAPKVNMSFELWADSFHEGSWCCTNLADAVVHLGGTWSVSKRHGFLQTYSYSLPGETFDVTVFGDYRAWDPLPAPVSRLLPYGKPDLIMYQRQQDSILFAVEETAAVPTGNQATQRCERMFGAARAGIPFWYLLPEYATRVDGGNRRDSIWPTIMALKLTTLHETPSVVAHYSDEANPDDYSAGIGQASIFRALLGMLCNATAGRDPLSGLSTVLEQQFAAMTEFVGDQWEHMVDFLPGQKELSSPDLPIEYADIATREPTKTTRNASSSLTLLKWPRVPQLPSLIRAGLSASPLTKPDQLGTLLEDDIGKGLAYGLSTRSGGKTQSAADVAGWISQQKSLFAGASASLSVPATWAMSVIDFPKNENGSCFLTTTPNTVYLYDDWLNLCDTVEIAFPRLSGRLPRMQGGQKSLVYVCNSLKPGRFLGDPFVGQLAAFSVCFGRFDSEPRAVLAYYPHQSFSQVNLSVPPPDSKGQLIVRDLTDVLLFGGGVAVTMNPPVVL